MRDNLDRAMSDLERLKSGNNYDQEGQRRAADRQLAENNCGPQYRAAAAAAGRAASSMRCSAASLIINPGGEGAPSGTYRTVCVRTCDGYYFPVSYSTVPSHFADDARTCQRECPATEVALYTYRNPGEDIGQAVSISGQPYTELPNAFHYRKEYSACLLVPPAGPELGRCAQRRRRCLDAGKRRHRRHRPERQSTVAAAGAERGPSRQGGTTAAHGTARAAPSGHSRPRPTAEPRPTPKGGVRTVGPPFVAGALESPFSLSFRSVTRCERSEPRGYKRLIADLDTIGAHLANR